MAKNTQSHLGDQWRTIEGPYPGLSSPNCVLLQFRKGTEWITMVGFKPDGTDIRSCVAIYSHNTSQAFANGTLTIVNYDTKVIDTDSAVATGSSWKFTCPPGKGGAYMVSASLQMTFPASTLIDSALIEIFKNSVRWARGNRIGFVTSVNGNGEGLLSVSTVVLNQGDTMDVRFSQTSGASRNSEGGNLDLVAITRVPITLP